MGDGFFVFSIVRKPALKVNPPGKFYFLFRHGHSSSGSLGRPCKALLPASVPAHHLSSHCPPAVSKTSVPPLRCTWKWNFFSDGQDCFRPKALLEKFPLPAASRRAARLRSSLPGCVLSSKQHGSCGNAFLPLTTYAPGPSFHTCTEKFYTLPPPAGPETSSLNERTQDTRPPAFRRGRAARNKIIQP